MVFKELYERHIDTAREEKEERGRVVLGTFCSYVPVELLHSFGILPLRIWGQANSIETADNLIQAYVCPPVRNLLAMGLEGRYGFLDGIVHGYSCDATCGLYNIWARNLQPRFAHMISLPYMDIEESREYARAELLNFIEKLEGFTGKRFSLDGLEESFGLYASARSALSEAYRLKDEAALPYMDFHYMNLCLQVLPVETCLPHLEDYRAAAEGRRAARDTKPRIMISGSVVSDTGLLSAIERNGVIAADDTCLGYRLVKDEPPESGDPLSRLISYYLGRTPCASRADFPARGRYLREALHDFEINAVIFIHQKFCDPHLSDHPYLKEILDGLEVPSLQLELEGDSFNAEVQTRLESFFEMIGAK